MENKYYLEQRLKELEEQLKEYHFLVEKLLDNPFLISDEERREFVQQNMEKIKERQRIVTEIGDIRWKLMTPQQQKDYIEKYSDD